MKIFLPVGQHHGRLANLFHQLWLNRPRDIAYVLYNQMSLLKLEAMQVLKGKRS